MRSIAIVALLGFAAATSEVEAAFQQWITRFERSYKSMEEYQFRLKEFARGYEQILAHNASDSSFKLGLNKMSDWTQDEYAQILKFRSEDAQETEFVAKDAAGTQPLDWRTSGCVSPIQDQGQCGSCWAFSSVAALETYNCLHGNQMLYKLSEQQLVDCVKTCFGCNGGNQSLAFRYYESNPAMNEASYPYTAMTGSCNYNSADTTGVATSGWTRVTENDADAMKVALETTMLSVSIQADQFAFQAYNSGIFSDPNCGTNLDHATDVVGWGSNGDGPGDQYWIMRNSWGTSWGEQGYMRIAIVDGVGLCGIQMSPLYPISTIVN